MIWQTTNCEPWVSALVAGDIKLKTRSQRPVVPIGAQVLLHCSKKVWPAWKWFDNEIMEKWVQEIPRLKKETFGKIIAVGTINLVCPIEEINEDWLGPWDMTWGNCAAPWAWTCSQIIKLNNPVAIDRGFQAPFRRAKPETVEKVKELNLGVLN